MSKRRAVGTVERLTEKQRDRCGSSCDMQFSDSSWCPKDAIAYVDIGCEAMLLCKRHLRMMTRQAAKLLGRKLVRKERT